ncbi:acyl-CoA N-acyltransferase [Thamnidium elegans]|nr:acyl-CoA N-acyltransferase [Thamnidium elegans]
MLETTNEYVIRRGHESEDEIIADNYYNMWLDIGTCPEDIEDNWKETVMYRIKKNRKDLKLSTIVIVDDCQKIVGSAACQIHSSELLHPDIMKRSVYQAGYLWGVFINPECRNKGLGKKMIKMCTEYFKEIGCHEAKLWASNKGKPIYRHEGYTLFDDDRIQEMVLKIK